jgi:hypothetical protein
VKRFTGLPSIVMLLGVFSIIEQVLDKINYWRGPDSAGQKRWQQKNQNKPGVKRKLSLFQEYIMTLVRLRLGLDTYFLGLLFGVSQTRVSQVFSTWINILHQVMSPLIKWPSKLKIQKYMPLCFKLKYPHTRVIIDCTELYVQRAKNPTAQSSTWSNYKSHNTYKALVCISPNGQFVFVSKLWTGNISDRAITERSGFIDLLEKGDHVMADRGFLIKDLLLKKGAYLNMPPFTRKANHGKGKILTAAEIKSTRRIASVRIHVERAIQRLKQFRLLTSTLPLTMQSVSNQMLMVAAVFCNFLPPLVKRNRTKR